MRLMGKPFFRFAIHLCLFISLTTGTQVGGLIYLACLPLFKIINRKYAGYWKRLTGKTVLFFLTYLITVVTLVPPLAVRLGRVPLPLFGNNNLKPLTLFTCLLNRHYVKPELRASLERVADQLQKQYPGTSISYLDANFPFINKFPLFPHLSHNDGKKVDLAFFYTQKGIELNGVCPSPIGYGVYEGPARNEFDQPSVCAAQGYRQYGLLEKLVPQSKKGQMPFDSARTRTLVNMLAGEPFIGKIFIEPHLKTRLNLHSTKIRFHGCQAVRHDDHVHVQLR
ncbi:MAG: hypothetical protein KDD36_01005 [Flavobacteriales bacterium]|nr:hypothetical protein [Flavobacteriales bacterium]